MCGIFSFKVRKGEGDQQGEEGRRVAEGLRAEEDQKGEDGLMGEDANENVLKGLSLMTVSNINMKKS